MLAPGNVHALDFRRVRDDGAWRHVPTRDLLAELEAARWLALEVADRADGSRAFVERQVAGIAAELERRQRLLARHRGDPLAPAWPKRDRELRDRIAAIKAAWPIERFVAELLRCEVERRGPDSLFCRCPLPGHRERTPSFHITPSKGLAFCQGCHRGGDVITLAMMVLGTDRISDALERLEAEADTPLGRTA